MGEAHERIGMPPKWYLGAYRRYMALLHQKLLAHFADPAEAHAAYHSVEKLVFLDMSIAIDTYIASNLDAIKRHQAAIRELSTPVIRVHERVLLLPLVGTIDSLRATQIMETVLTKVSEEQAKVLILDIAGVPVVDTKVADHLLKTTAAVRLLGAKTILTGISAQVARTIIQLGVDISSMETQSRLPGRHRARALDGRQGHHREGGLGGAGLDPHPARGGHAPRHGARRPARRRGRSVPGGRPRPSWRSAAPQGCSSTSAASTWSTRTSPASSPIRGGWRG